MTENIKIAIGSDHAGFDYKKILIPYLKSLAVIADVKDFGTDSPDSVDYPDFAHPVASAVENKEFDFGILICGSANGVAITANKHQGIRAAICWKPELAKLAKAHNNANVLCIPERFITETEAKEIVDAFLATSFEAGRHSDRVGKISC